jgi:PAS domain S-box-containing protein
VAPENSIDIERLRLAAEAAAIGTWDFDPITNTLEWDWRCRELFGLPPEAKITYDGSFLAALHPEDRARTEAAVREAIEHGRDYDIEYRAIGIIDGVERWIAARGKPVRRDGKTVRFIGTVMDIGARKQAQLELRSLTASLEARVQKEVQTRIAAELSAHSISEQFRLLVEGVVDYAIYMLDLEGYVSTWNAGAERIKGYSAAEVIGKHFSMFYTDQARETREPWRLLEEAHQQGRAEIEGWRVRKDGTKFWASVVVDAVRNNAGQLIGFAKITRDIAAQRQAAKELEVAREALFQAQKMESIGRLTGGIAHDFNNMLAGILGGLALLERRITAKRFNETEKYIASTIEVAHRAAALTSRLLAFGRRQALDVAPVDVGAAIRSVTTILKATFGENIVLDIQEPDGLIALADINQLESAILNLSLNARDAMPDGGKLSISAARQTVSPGHAELEPGDYIVVVVKDTGVGMTPDVAAHVFEPFYTTKPSGAGTGLGLSMVYGFMKQIGGAATIASAPGEGAAVSLFLKESKEGEISSAAAKNKIEVGSGEIILIVEDDSHVRGVIIDMLADLGYKTLAAGDVQKALPHIDSSMQIDLLITDVGLPGINGRQLADIARRKRAHLPVLFLTGYAAQAAVKAQFLERGMELMTKPFDLDALAAKVKEMLGAGKDA